MRLVDHSTNVGSQPYDNSWANPSLEYNQTTVDRKEKYPGRNVFFSRCPGPCERDSFLTISIGKETPARHHLPLRPRPLVFGPHKTLISARVNHMEMNTRLGRIMILINNKSRLSPPRRQKPARTNPLLTLLRQPSRKPTLKPLAGRTVFSSS